MVSLTKKQNEALDLVVHRVIKDAEPMTVLAGYAGTGKSTLIAALLASAAVAGLKIAVGVPTGMGANVLRKMGIRQATTIHRVIYTPVESPDGSVRFVRKDTLDYDFGICDEGSMVTKPIHEDLSSFNIPWLYVGDPNQLEPVGPDPKIMSNADVMLTEVHRQALKNPIIRLGIDIREGRFKFGKDYGSDAIRWGDYGDFIDSAGKVSQMMSGTNKTRNSINKAWRKSMGYRKLLCVGERVICLKNNHKMGLFNGMTGRVASIVSVSEQMILAVIVIESNLVTLKMRTSTLRDGFPPDRVDPMEYDPEVSDWTYGYCITLHKAQGSEFKTTAVYEELHPSWNAMRWRTTACSRPRKEILYCR